jgi:hypothetical protein
LLGQDPSARPPTGYVWTKEGLKTVWETNGYAPPDYEKFVQEALGNSCIATRVFPGRYGTIEGLFSGLEGFIPQRHQKWRYYGLPQFVPSSMITPWCPLPHPFPVATVYRYMPTALATHFLLIRNASPPGTGLPLSSLFGGNVAVLYFLVQKYTPFGPVLHEPYANGMYMVRADLTVPLMVALFLLDIQGDLVVYDTWNGTRNTVSFREFVSSLLPMFVIAKRFLIIQYPTLAPKLLAMRYDDRTPEQVQQGWFPPPPLLQPAQAEGAPQQQAADEEEQL